MTKRFESIINADEISRNGRVYPKEVLLKAMQDAVNDHIPVDEKPCEDVAISRKHLLSEIDELMKSPWFNNGKDFYDGTLRHYGYVERKEAVEVVRDLCVKAEPSVTLKPLDKIRAEIEQEYTKFRNKSDRWSERACGLGTALEIIDKYRKGVNE